MSPLGPAQAAQSQDLLSAPALPPGWKGEDSSVGVCLPPGRQRSALSPCWDVSGSRGCPHPSPGTVGWRRRGRHWRRATLNRPPAQHEQKDGLGGIWLLPAWCWLPGLEPESPALQGTSGGILRAQYQEAAPASGGPEEGAAPFLHVDQAPLGHGTARLQHHLLGPEDPRLALEGMERFTARLRSPGWPDSLGGSSPDTARTHPEIGVGVQRLHPRDVSIWRAWRG